MLRTHRFTTAAAIAIGLGAAAPTAASALITPDAIDAGQPKAPQIQDYRTPDAVNPVEPTTDLRAPDNRFGQPTGDTTVPIPTPARVRIVEVPSSGFEWGDAGIGAAGMLAVVALGAGAGLAGAQRRRSRVAR
jgi:hypothetical protein